MNCRGLRRAVAAGMLMAVPAVLSAQDMAEALFQQHCAVCHGADATGGGPLAPALVLQPPDLTRLAERNEGVFPVLRVVMRIDGREPLVSHGSPMPVYGDFFEESGRDTAIAAETGQPILAAEGVVELTEYLRALQR